MHCYAVQPEHHLWTVQTTAELTPFSGSVNTALCDFWYTRRLRKTLTYLLEVACCASRVWLWLQGQNVYKFNNSATFVDSQCNHVVNLPKSNGAGFGWKCILTLPWPLRIEFFNTIGQCTAKLLMAEQVSPARFSGGLQADNTCSS